MRLNFVLHDFSKAQPGGGLKVEYEFANRMAARGHDVVVYHSLNFTRGALGHPRSFAGAIRFNIAGPRAVEWFPVSAAVRCRYLPQIVPALLRRADATIVDSFAVTERVRRTTRTGPIVHVVYEYPVWRTADEPLRARLVRSLQRPDVTRIATSAAIENMLAQCGSSAVAKITCGIELPELSAIPRTVTRSPVVGFALRPEPHKSVVDMLHALPGIREACPQAEFEAFGHYPAVEHPREVRHHGYLDDLALQAFYQRVSVFASPSHAEGWGLTVAEAMANGAAVVVAENGGSADFAVDGETALVVPTAAPDALTAAIAALLNHDVLRARIVARGIARSRKMSWEHSVTALEQLLVKLTRASHVS